MKKSLLITTALISLILPYSVMAEDLIVNGNQVIDDDERFYYGKIVVNQGGELTITDSAFLPSLLVQVWNESLGSLLKQLRLRQSFQSARPISGSPCGPMWLGM